MFVIQKRITTMTNEQLDQLSMTTEVRRAAKRTDNQARRSAKRIGFKAIKAHHRRQGCNQGGYMLINADGRDVTGRSFTLSAQDVMEFCKTWNNN